VSPLKELKGEIIAEFIGSFILVFLGAGSVAALILNDTNYTMWDISMIWGVAVSLALYITAAISGAHINPAVTLALALYRGFPWKKVLPYILAQIGGTFTATAFVYGLYYSGFLQYEILNNIVRGSSESQTLASIFSTYPAPYLSYLQAAFVEITITAFLIVAIFSFIDEKNSFAPPKALFPLAVGMVIAVLGGAFGSLTGFAMNPARDFGPKLFTALVGWGPIAFSGIKGYFWVPIIAPLFGGVIGGAVYNRFIGKYLHSIEAELQETGNHPIKDSLLQEQEKSKKYVTASTKTY
jgi:glycerol uptake facilitator protein